MKIRLQVKPNSKYEEVTEIDGCYKVKVKEPPTEGKANRAVVKLMAKHLGVTESSLRLCSGKRSKIKVIEIL